MLDRRRLHPRLQRPAEVHRGIVDQNVDAELQAAGDLVVGAVEFVVRQPDLVQPAGGVRVRVGGAVRGDLDEVALLVPAGDRLHRAGVGLGGEHVLGAVGLLHARAQLLGGEPVDRPRLLPRVGQIDSVPALGDLGELVPIRVQRRVDVDREAHGRWYGSGVSGFLGQVRAVPGHALLRGVPDDDYADGDDSTWMSVDWPALTRTVRVLGRDVNIVDTGGDGPPPPVLHRLGRP